jgi:hypothetical protein
VAQGRTLFKGKCGQKISAWKIWEIFRNCGVGKICKILEKIYTIFGGPENFKNLGNFINFRSGDLI